MPRTGLRVPSGGVPSEAEVISQYYAWYRAWMGITAQGLPAGQRPGTA